MQNTRQTVVSLEISTTTVPVELSLDLLTQVAGGRGPNSTWAAAEIVAGPNSNWAVAMGPNSSW